MVLGLTLSFVVGLLVGGLAIHVGASLIVGSSSYSKALITAAVAWFAWAVVSLFVGWLPLLGPVVGLLVYVGVINVQYDAGWLKAGAVAFVAWVTSLLALALLRTLSLGVEVVGVPGV
ncbi:hypothetical protein ACFQL1_08895 [Halomicroarcula sp. GCM10025709]|uniref:hypothetical protein n=1 Tax=Haloarcula TaxID=2237 RepID=UPI0024C2CB3E|nr:hypothetical protein [Halomicroarcula sp. YJ-61-S]